MARQKQILSLEEGVVLKLSEKKLKLKGKVDTGAHFTSVDLSIAKLLGYDKSIKLFQKHCPKFKINKNNHKKITQKIKAKYKKQLIKKCPGLVDVKLHPASNGFSVRPYFKIEFKLKNKTIKTKASFTDRSHLTYAFLIGKQDMRGFLVAANKLSANKKLTIGLTEDIKLKLPNKKIKTIKTKIDTGARYTALDVSLAKKLGYEKSLKLFQKHCPKFKINKNNFKKIRKKIRTNYQKQLIKKCPGLVYVTVIPASNGFSVRPYFKIEFKLKNKTIKTKASFVDRAFMNYLILIGKNDLDKFLIDPSKNPYNTL